MAGRGGWFKSYDDELDDPKIARLSDFEYRVWRTALDFCNRSPGRLRRSGALYHSEGFPVEAADFGRALRRRDREVQAALDRLCEIGGGSSLLERRDSGGTIVYRVRAWRKRQDGQDGDEAVTGGDETVPELCQSGDSLCGPYVDVDVDKDLDPHHGPAAAAPAAGASRSCSWCTNPTDPDATDQPEPRRLAQVYHDAHRERFGSCPLCLAGKARETGKEFSALARILTQAGGFPRAVALIRHGLASEDPFLAENGYTPSIIASKLQGIAQAFDEGRTHGARRPQDTAGRNRPRSGEDIARSW